jgi:hypothetical protein
MFWSVVLYECGPSCVADAVGASGALAAEAVPGCLAVAAAVAGARVVGPTAVMVGRRLAVLSGCPVVSLDGCLTPLRRRIHVRVGGLCAFTSLPRAAFGAVVDFFFDVVPACADAVHLTLFADDDRVRVGAR